MIIFKKGMQDTLIEHSKTEFPNEACGILSGKNNKVEKIYRMTNSDRSGKAFFMDPKEQLSVMKEIRNLNLEMIGIYHSHSETEAYPSSHDIELAYYPEASYVIVSIKEKSKPQIKSFKIVEGKVAEEPIEYY